MRKLWYILAIAIMTTLYAGFAAAHSYLVKSSPAADAVVMQAPKEIRLSFNEGIQPRSSTVALTAISFSLCRRCSRENTKCGGRPLPWIPIAFKAVSALRSGPNA